MCIDDQQLINHIETDIYALPRIDQLMDNLAGMNWYTRIDLRDAFKQLRMHPDSQKYTTFSCQFCSYCYRVMPFGLLVAPAFFQRFINSLLGVYYGKNVMCYMDDILIYTKTYKKNEKRTRQVIHGFTNYLRNFIHGYSDLIRPIQKLVHGQKKSIFWDEEAENSFGEIKNAFKKTENLFFNLPTVREQIILKCDASDTACGSVLMTVKRGYSISDVSNLSDAEISANPDFKICSYSSHMFSTTEQRYTTIEKELMAIVTGLQAYNTVVRSSELTEWILTDHHNLLFLEKFELRRRRHFKWFDILCNYNYEIAYVQGSKNEVADGLSRPNALQKTQVQIIFKLSECKMINTLKNFGRETLKRIQSVHESSTWSHPGVRNMIYILKFEEVVSGINRSEVEMVV
jgi:Reverse transcriptase (RNA-dependent DNA polymerase)/RNase H-like domain found in reverse transcriptase